MRKAIVLVALFPALAFAQPNVPPPTQPPVCGWKACYVPPPPPPPVLVAGPPAAPNLLIQQDGMIRFDYNATVVWSRYAVSEYLPPGRPVYVLTYVNGPGGLRPVWMMAWEPTP